MNIRRKQGRSQRTVKNRKTCATHATFGWTDLLRPFNVATRCPPSRCVGRPCAQQRQGNVKALRKFSPRRPTRSLFLLLSCPNSVLPPFAHHACPV
jgi:hypothetical protein